MAFFAASGDSEVGFHAFDQVSAKSKKYDAKKTLNAWEAIKSSPPSHIGIGTLIHEAKKIDPNFHKKHKLAKAKNSDKSKELHGRSFIEVNPGRIDECAEQSEQALASLGSIYQRRGLLVRIVRLPEQAGDNGVSRQAGSLIIRSVDVDYLRAQMCKAAQYEKWSAANEDWYTVDPPVQVARTVLSSAGDWPNIANLRAISEVPLIAPNGEIVGTPGFNARTGIYLDPAGIEFPKVPEHPSIAEAQEALRVLMEPLKNFPFDSDASCSVALAQLLTPFCRPFLRSSPLFVNTAPKRGSGKTLLATICSYVATGRAPASMSQEDNPEAENKRLLSLLLESSIVSVIDNIERPLQSASMCTILTEPMWKERVLGRSEMAEVSTCTTWVATGNNVQVMGDMAARVLVCTIDPACENPEEREFSVNLHKWVPENRGRLAAAALTILRAYYLARERGEGVTNLTTFGRFEDWSTWIREPLVWLGLADPYLTRKVAEAHDPEREQIAALAGAWYSIFGKKPQTVKTVVKLTEPPDYASPSKSSDGDEEKKIEDLREALEMIAGDARGNVSNKRLGWFLKKVQNRYENGFKFVRDSDDRTNTARWYVASESDTDKTLHKKSNDNSALDANAGFCRVFSQPTRGEVNLCKSEMSKEELENRNQLDKTRQNPADSSNILETKKNDRRVLASVLRPRFSGEI